MASRSSCSGTDESWEVRNNTSDRVLYKSADYSGDAWLGDYEARFPDTDPPYTDPAQLQEFAEWVVSTDTEKATGDLLPEPVTYGEEEYTHDTSEYPRAKNMFPSFMGGVISA